MDVVDAGLERGSGQFVDAGEAQPPTSSPTGVIESVLFDRRTGAVVAIALAVAFALVSAWWTPRGPVTTAQALVSMGAALLVGVGIGLAIGNRWSLLLGPTVFVVVFELARVGIDGPTVDAIDLSSLYGVLALVLGRVVPGLLVLVPMMLGSAYGWWLAARLAGRPSKRGAVSWTIIGLLTGALAAMAFFIARPATTAPILDADGEVLAGSVAELATVTIGGHDQVMMIRGRSVDSPVLLYLTGGPGGTDLGAMRADVGLEQSFVVVTWDQRGAGKSYPAIDPTETLTLDQMVSDTIEVTHYLRDRFGEDRIYLVGQSWGSTLGALAAQQRPDLYHAFVGVGQMVSQRATDVMFWEDALSWAERVGEDGLAESLRANGPPPYENLNHYAPVVSYEHEWNPYAEFDPGNEMPAILFVPEYTVMDRLNAFRGFLDTNGTLYPQLQGLDFRTDIAELDVPYYMVLGEHEARGRAVLAEEWYEMLDAPSKQRVIFDGGGHRAHFDRPALFAELMDQVLFDTADQG